MPINHEVDLHLPKKWRRSGRHIPKWIIYSAGGIGVLMCVGLIKTLLPVIGMAFLLALIWSKAKNTRGY